MATRQREAPDPERGRSEEVVRLDALEAEVRELTHDLTALAMLAGQQFGEPFRSKATEIVTKRQTGNGRKP